MPVTMEAALRYAALGYPVFPCVPGGKAPLTPRGFKDATTDPGQIQSWWEKYPDANVGMPTAVLLVIDVDGTGNPWPADAEKALDLVRGPVSRTPRGGRHHLFRQPSGKAWRNTAGKIAPKVDTRADGGYIVVPPSAVDGNAYHWLEGMELAVPPGQLPEPSGWLVDLLDAPGDPFTKEIAGSDGDGVDPVWWTL